MKYPRFSVKALRRAASVAAIFALLIVMARVQTAQALTLTSLKDTLSTITDGANANHAISWVSPSGVANAATIVITFPTGFDFTGVVIGDVDLDGSTEGSLTLGADCSLSEKASYSRTGQVITFTLCAGDGGDFTNSETITVKIGTNAAGGTNQINNQTVAQNNSDPTIDITSGASDTGSLAVEIITDDSVNITANVDPSITFSISDTTIGFGTLSTTSDCWALGTAPASCDTTFPAPAAHTMSAGTNAAGGLAVTYSGALLTSAANDIDAATISGDTTDPVGTTGSEQFAIGFDDNGTTFSMVSGYDQNVGNYTFVASTTTTIFTSSGPVASTAVDSHYLANIAANTPAGNYTTDITYIATGTF